MEPKTKHVQDLINFDLLYIYKSGRDYPSCNRLCTFTSGFRIKIFFFNNADSKQNIGK